MIGYCATCRADAVITSRGVCSWCNAPHVPTLPPVATYRTGNAPGAYWITEQQLRDAHVAHVGGESIRSIARRLYPGTRYASDKSLAITITHEFHRRGWYTRSRLDQTVLSSTIHGRARRGKADPAYTRELRVKAGITTNEPRCAAEAKRTGVRCLNTSLRTSVFCHVHTNPAAAVEQCAAMRRRNLEGAAS